mgnify:CR=1 FL=1|tara:strand:+ start:1309 stop:1974 length:666 start_codon:yes stop_codon:yes gene_type:complete
MIVAIVPAFNEEKRIGSVVRNLFSHVDFVVVVNDASTDATAEIAREAGATVLSHATNRGQGAALETGHVFARTTSAEYVLHFDGDGQFDVADISPALSAMKDAGVDVLFGSRYLDNRSASIPWFKRHVLRPFATYLIDRPFTGLSLSDTHNGFRILHKNALAKLYISQDGMAHATEIPFLVHKHNLSFIEFPVKVTYYTYGQSATAGLTIVKDLFFGKFLK